MSIDLSQPRVLLYGYKDLSQPRVLLYGYRPLSLHGAIPLLLLVNQQCVQMDISLMLQVVQ